MDVEVVLVNPIYEGNVGAVARVMKNFGYSKLALIDPCVFGSFARAMASHAQDVLDSARLTTLEGVLRASNLVIGTTGIVGSKANLRTPYPLARLGGKLSGMHGTASILFGAEDQGLPNAVLQECDMIVNIQTSPEYPVMNISHAAAIVPVSYTHLRAHETRHDLVCRLLPRSTPLYSSAASDVYKRQVLQECDMIVNIQTSPEYPVMNISHAAAIVLYNIAKTVNATPKRKVALHSDLDRLLQHANDVLELIDFPTHKRQRVSNTMKRIFSRSELSAAEVRTLRGILSRIEHRLRR